MNSIDVKIKKLSEYLSLHNGTLLIPYSQRPYEWGEEQVKRLFDDLISVYENDDIYNYPLNTVTISVNGKNKEIYDGQQRTITLLLLLTVFINHFHNNIQIDYDRELAVSLRRDYIVQENRNSYKRKITFSPDLKEAENFFYELSTLPNSVDTLDEKYLHNPVTKLTIQNMYNNYKLLENYLNTYIEKSDIYDNNDLEDILNTILENVILVVIETDDIDLAMTMFESINNTGKTLDSFYVLKNDFLRVLDESEVSNHWNNMLKNLNNLNTNDFFKIFVSIKVPNKVKKSNALSELYSTVDKYNIKDMHKALKELDNSSRLYKLITYPSNIEEKNKEAKKFIELSNLINSWKIRQHHQLILAMMLQNYDWNDINKILQSLIRVYISTIYFFGARANILESLMSSLSNKVYTGKINDINDIRKEIQQLLPTKNELVTRIETFNVENKKQKIDVIKFILRKIYSIDLQEIEISNNNNSIHYEHILPQKLKEDSKWTKLFTPEEHDEYFRRIGNATLLYGKKNSAIGNSDFSKKREFYKQSDLEENKIIALEEEWTKESIDKRSAQLAQKIYDYLEKLDPKV